MDFYKPNPKHLVTCKSYYPAKDKDTLYAKAGPCWIMSNDNGLTWSTTYVAAQYLLLEKPETTKPEWVEAINAIVSKNMATMLGDGQGSYRTGSDPELFAVDENDVIIPAFSYLGPKKGVIWVGKATQPYWDGFQAEFNIKDDECNAWVVDGIRQGIKLLYDATKAKYPKASLTHKCVLPVPPAMMKETPLAHVGFGCSPSFNAYGEPPMEIGNPRALLWRFAGCHIHFGKPALVEKDDLIKEHVKAIDSLLGPMMTLLLQGLEDPLRRAFYGKAGEYRRPKHGIEYRTPSSAILMHPILTHLVFDVARAATHWQTSLPYKQWWKGSEEQTRAILNDLDLNEAHKALTENKELYRGLFEHRYQEPKRLFDFIERGAKEFVSTNMEANWRLDSNKWITHSEGENESVITSSFLNGKRLDVALGNDAEKGWVRT